jgi:hypothetical protein
MCGWMLVNWHPLSTSGINRTLVFVLVVMVPCILITLGAALVKRGDTDGHASCF